MTASEAFDLARRKARYGHRDWVVWCDRNGDWHTDRYSVASLKAAMLAIGTKGHFSVIEASTAIGHRYNWPLACLARRNAKWMSA